MNDESHEIGALAYRIAAWIVQVELELQSLCNNLLRHDQANPQTQQKEKEETLVLFCYYFSMGFGATFGFLVIVIA